MNADLILENLTNPSLLFFILGLLVVAAKSDLTIPDNSSRFISLYLLFSIGFKGGQELSHSNIDEEVIAAILVGVGSALILPFLFFFVLRRVFSIENAGAIAAAYGSISAVTFITCINYLEQSDIHYGGHMVAIMALMEAPAIITGVLVIRYFSNSKIEGQGIFSALKHAVTNASVFLIVGALVIGYMANEKQAEGIAPFTSDIFQGFLAIFLLDMGITAGKKINSFFNKGWWPILFGLLFPITIGTLMAFISGFFLESHGDRLLLTMLTASASYIAVPAAMKITVPKADSGIFLPMALVVTFPFNITLGIPLFHQLIQTW